MTAPTSPSSDDEALSGLIDGTLPGDEAVALRERLDREPTLAARFAAMERADRAVRDAYRDVVDEPLPERALALLRAPKTSADKVVDLDARRRARVLPVWFPQAIAAGIALAVGLGLGFGLGQRSGEAPTASLLAATGTVASGSPLYELLEFVPSGETRALGAATAEARFTFRTLGGDWCRELMVSSAAARNAAVACRRDGGWRVELVGVEAAGGDVYRPAGAGEAPLREAVDALIDGEPLEPDVERALVARGWAND